MTSWRILLLVLLLPCVQCLRCKRSFGSSHQESASYVEKCKKSEVCAVSVRLNSNLPLQHLGVEQGCKDIEKQRYLWKCLPFERESGRKLRITCYCDEELCNTHVSNMFQDLLIYRLSFGLGPNCPWLKYTPHAMGFGEPENHKVRRIYSMNTIPIKKHTRVCNYGTATQNGTSFCNIVSKRTGRYWILTHCVKHSKDNVHLLEHRNRSELNNAHLFEHWNRTESILESTSNQTRRITSMNHRTVVKFEDLFVEMPPLPHYSEESAAALKEREHFRQTYSDTKGYRKYSKSQGFFALYFTSVFITIVGILLVLYVTEELEDDVEMAMKQRDFYRTPPTRKRGRNRSHTQKSFSLGR